LTCTLGSNGEASSRGTALVERGRCSRWDGDVGMRKTWPVTYKGSDKDAFVLKRFLSRKVVVTGGECHGSGPCSLIRCLSFWLSVPLAGKQTDPQPHGNRSGVRRSVFRGISSTRKLVCLAGEKVVLPSDSAHSTEICVWTCASSLNLPLI